MRFAFVLLLALASQTAFAMGGEGLVWGFVLLGAIAIAIFIFGLLSFISLARSQYSRKFALVAIAIGASSLLIIPARICSEGHYDNQCGPYGHIVAALIFLGTTSITSVGLWVISLFARAPKE